MKGGLAIFVMFYLIAGSLALADEHVVSGDQGAASIRWVWGGQRSMVTGEDARPGQDGAWRLHVKVKNGDLVLFADSPVVFENGADEVGKVWEVAEFLNGTKGKIGPLTDAKQKAFYKNPDKALGSVEPFQGQSVFLIRIKNLTADRPILFASWRISHIDKRQGNKHFMFGAIMLDTSTPGL